MCTCIVGTNVSHTFGFVIESSNRTWIFFTENCKLSMIFVISLSANEAFLISSSTCGQYGMRYPSRQYSEKVEKYYEMFFTIGGCDYIWLYADRFICFQQFVFPLKLTFAILILVILGINRLGSMIFVNERDYRSVVLTAI